ncbi:DUF397 domain-containing protein [Streptomyces sp. NPDC059866]|uniref:DUF397 domain-containing protein n=1 Tax=Streptomyces sp. NPDC059866 TaxID=3346978 RepID=UPI0036648EC6
MSQIEVLTTALGGGAPPYEVGANGCVEVADGYPGVIPVRDSRAPTARPLIFSVVSWSTFVERVKAEVGLNT